MKRTRPGSLVSSLRTGLMPLQPAKVKATERGESVTVAAWRGGFRDRYGRRGVTVHERWRMGYVNLRETERERQREREERKEREESEVKGRAFRRM